MRLALPCIRGGGGVLGIYTGGDLRCGYSPPPKQKGGGEVLGAGATRKGGGLMCGHNQKNRGRMCG